MEALCYVFIYFLKGALPWQGLKGNTKQVKYDAIMEKKITTTAKELCAGLPREFLMYLEYVRNLRFEDTPDYTQLRQLFRDLFIRKGFVFDYVFDWIAIKNQVLISYTLPFYQLTHISPHFLCRRTKNCNDSNKESHHGDQLDPKLLSNSNSKCKTIQFKAELWPCFQV
jgi:hypothetical protein